MEKTRNRTSCDAFYLNCSPTTKYVNIKSTTVYVQIVQKGRKKERTKTGDNKRGGLRPEKNKERKGKREGK